MRPSLIRPSSPGGALSGSSSVSSDSKDAGFRDHTKGQFTVEFAFIRNLQSSETSSAKKRRKEYKWQCDVRSVNPVVVAVDILRIASRVADKTVASKVCGASGTRCPHVWCSCVAQVSDTHKELLSQDHSAPPTPPQLCGNRRLVSMMVRVGRRVTEPLRVMMTKNGRPKRMVKHSTLQGT